MRLQLYVPARQANRWDPAPGFISWQALQSRVAAAAGGVYVHSASAQVLRVLDGYGQAPVFIVEALIPSTRHDAVIAGHTEYQAAYAETWAVFRDYARQLIALGEESVLIVSDNEPTLIK